MVRHGTNIVAVFIHSGMTPGVEQRYLDGMRSVERRRERQAGEKPSHSRAGGTVDLACAFWRPLHGTVWAGMAPGIHVKHSLDKLGLGLAGIQRRTLPLACCWRAGGLTPRYTGGRLSACLS